MNSGGQTGGARGEVARLLAQPFPYSSAAVRVASKTLAGPTLSYSFTVAPTLATRYRVELFRRAAATKVLAASA